MAILEVWRFSAVGLDVCVSVRDGVVVDLPLGLGRFRGVRLSVLDDWVSEHPYPERELVSMTVYPEHQGVSDGL